MDNFDDELRSHLAGSAASIVAEPVGVDHVEHRGRRRGRRRRAIAVVATVALVGAAAVGIRPLVTNDESTLDVAAGTPAATPDPGNGAASPSAAANDGAVSAPTNSSTPTAVESASSADRGPGGDSGWVVPWGDGFLSIEVSSTFTESPTLTPEFIAAFPSEIAAVIEASGASSLREMGEALNDAGLAGQAAEFLSNGFPMVDMLAVGQSSSRLLVQQSTDGSTWTEVAGFDPPIPADSIGRVVSDGTHLVIQQRGWGSSLAADGVGYDTAPDPPALSVLVTTDLTDWQTFDITPPVVGSPPYVRNEQWVSDLAIGPDGWLASVQSSSYIDLRTLLPAELRGREGGIDYRETPDGIQVDTYPQFEGPESLVTGGEEVGTGTATASTPVPIETRLYPWAELGLDPTEVANLGALRSESRSETVISVGTWDGWVRSSSRGADSGYLEGQTVGTDAGFLTVRHGPETAGPVIEFSPDGIGWSAAEQLSGDWIGGLVSVEGGVLANVSGPDGTAMWRGSPAGTDWTEVDIAGIGDGLRSLYGQQTTGPGFVSVIDVSKAVETSEPDVEFDVEIEQDGQSIHLYAHDDGTADLIITDLATGEIVADITGAYSGIDAEFIKIGDDSVTIIDNDGNEVASIPLQLVMDTVLPARAKAIEATGWQPPPPPPPELMVVASADGLQWLVTPFEAPGPVAQYEGYPSAMAINGPTVAVRTGGWWQTFRIG